jgi:hypothetical protein
LWFKSYSLPTGSFPGNPGLIGFALIESPSILGGDANSPYVILKANRSVSFFSVDDVHGTSSGESSANVWAVNEWSQLVVAGNLADHKLRLYLNGSLIHEMDLPSYGQRFKNLLFGADRQLLPASQSDVYFDGAVDDIRIYNRALSSEDILALFESEKGPFIEQQPTSRLGYSGQSTTFTVSAVGTGTLMYQWRKNGVNIPNATSSSLTLSPLNYRSPAEYDVVVSDDYGSATSSTATLTVLSPAPNVSITPGDTTVALGGGLTFTAAVATGIPPFTYQWRRNGTTIAKATNSTLVLTNFQRTQEGIYDVVVKNGHGVDISKPARLSLPPVVTVNTSPESTDVNPAGTATFTVNVPGATAWQWLKNGISIKGAITSTLNVPNVDASSAGLYSVTVTTPNGKVTTAPAQLRVNDSGLLIYKLTGTGKAYEGTVATNAAISGYLVLDRAGQRGGLIIGSKSGSQNIHRAEIHEDLDTQSTGPVPKSQTVVSELVAGEFALWMNGTDGLLTISKTDKAVGPATMKGFANSIDLGSNVRMETVSLTLTLDAVNSTPSRLFQETVEQAMSRISQDMQAKGSALIER